MAKGITFFSKLSSAVANATFFIKNADFDEIISRVVLKNTAEAESGTQINNVQRYLNELGDTTGYTEGDANRKVYATNNLITNGETRKECIEIFDIAVQANIDQIALNLAQILKNTKVVHLHQVIINNAQLTFAVDSKDQEFRISGAAPIVLNAIPFTNQPADGTITTITCHSDIGTVRINDNEATPFGFYLKGDMILRKNDTARFTYNAELQTHIEIGRNT